MEIRTSLQSMFFNPYLYFCISLVHPLFLKNYDLWFLSLEGNLWWFTLKINASCLRINFKKLVWQAVDGRSSHIRTELTVGLILIPEWECFSFVYSIKCSVLITYCEAIYWLWYKLQKACLIICHIENFWLWVWIC